MSRRVTIILPVVLVLTGYTLMGVLTKIWAAVFIVILYAVRGFTLPVFTHYINQQVASDRRATVLSIRVLGTRLLFCILGPLAGWISDSYSLQHAIIITGIILSVLGCLSFAALVQAKNKIKQN